MTSKVMLDEQVIAIVTSNILDSFEGNQAKIASLPLEEKFKITAKEAKQNELVRNNRYAAFISSVNATMILSNANEQQIIIANLKKQNPDIVINFHEIFDNV